MGRSLYEAFPAARDVFDQACEVLGSDLVKLCFEGPEESLRQTENAQVALFTTSMAAWRAFQATCPLKGDAAAGHSVGEYAALAAAGSLGFEDGLRLVRTRAELMRDAGRRAPGAMTALLGIEAEAARDACDEARAEGAGIVSVANYNGGGQVVLSGETAAVERAAEISKTRGARRVVPLPVSGAFHSPLMVTAGDALFQSLTKIAFAKPEIPVVLNVDAEYATNIDGLIGELTMQVSRSVRWEESMRRLLADGISTFVELGSGDVLTGLMRRIDKTAKAVSVQDADSLQAACELLQSAG